MAIVDTFNLKQHDLGPAYPFRAITPSGTAISLAGATAVATMQPVAGGTNIFERQACSITDATEGEGHYQWQAGNTDVTGNFYLEIEVTPASGGKFTIPANGNIQINITSDLDGV